jgi:hypothetical protein
MSYRNSIVAALAAAGVIGGAYATTQATRIDSAANNPLLGAAAACATGTQKSAARAFHAAQRIDPECAMCFWVEAPIEAAPCFAHAQFSDPSTVLAIEPPSDVLPYVKGLWHYSRAIAHVTSGDTERAESELKRLQSKAKDSDFSALGAGGMPATDVLAIAEHDLARS